MASQVDDSNPNTLILLGVGDPPVLPVSTSTNLPANILYLDVLALEYQLLRRAQERGSLGAPDRHASLTSLASLLQTLQIPVPPFATLGNAGNEAFYTVLAFQKLMMNETHLPDILFSQPQTMFTHYSGHFPSFHVSGEGPRYAIPVIPHFAPHEHTRTASGSSSHRQSDYILPTESSVSSPQRIRRSSENPRLRPLPIDTISTTSRQDMMKQPGSAPATIPGERGPLPRSQTVYWDDSEYADAGHGHQSGPRNRESTLRPSLTGGDPPRGRMPPSALRASSGPPSSRSISWEAEKIRTSTRTSSAASSPLRGSRPPTRMMGTSSSSLNQEVFGSSSKLSSGSERRSSVDVGKGKSPGEGKEGKGKLRSEMSVRDVAGAIAKFWVG